MGVHGLWRLLDATGKPVPVETLEGKILAIDVSIWIHQVLQGYQDRRGSAIPNAHLLGLYHRICKLLYFKIKPIFVFDGGVPLLKKNTVAARRKQKSIATSKAQKMKEDLINNLIKHTAVKSVLNNKDNKDGGHNLTTISKSNDKSAYDIFKLPDLPEELEQTDNSDQEYTSDSVNETSPRKQTKWAGNIYNVDIDNAEFKSLPADVRYDILTDLKETRKQSSWGRLHELPEESNEFSGFQIKRLLKRRRVQEFLESAEQEMGGKTLTLEELNKLLTEQGIDTKGRDAAYRIAGDSTTRLLYISDKNQLSQDSSQCSSQHSTNQSTTQYEDEGASTSQFQTDTKSIIDDLNEYEMSDDWDSEIEYIESINFPSTSTNFKNINDSISNSDINESVMLSQKFSQKFSKNPALTYMLEYSGLTQEQIISIMEQNHKQETDKSIQKGKKSSLKKNISSKNDFEKIEEIRETNENQSDDIIFISKEENNVSSLKNSNSDLNETVKVSEFTESINSEENVQKNKVGSEINDSKINEDIEIKISDVTKIINSIDNTSDASVVEKHVLAPTFSPTDQFSKKVDENDENIIDSTSDSESDFIEIKDVPIPCVDEPIPCVKKEPLQIMFHKDDKLEDDIFADLFDKRNDSQIKMDIKPADDEVREIITIKQEIDLDNIKNKLVDDSKESSYIDKNIILSPILNKDIENKNELMKSSSISSSNDSGIGGSFSIGSSSQEDIIGKSQSETEKPVLNLPTEKIQLQTLQEQLENEQHELTGNIGRLERQATDVTDQIRIEAQELLQLFGIPYIVAPMEAEAQCAYLEEIGLTNGTITDDSDIWLFGGRCVYKNFFNNEKKVLQFLSCDIQHHFKLTRQQMIQLALLVGSDYTIGITGIGPVTALEILAAFPSDNEDILRGLYNFASWMKCGRTANFGRATLRNKLRNVEIEKGFPSQAVAQAYLFPMVDESKEKFTWSKPNMTLLCDYVKRKFGWTKLKFEEIMGPVIKKMEEKKSQKGIENYFRLQAIPKSVEARLSKRVQSAIKKINNELTEQNEQHNVEETDDNNKEIDKSKEKLKKSSECKKRKLVSEESTSQSVSSEEKNVTKVIPNIKLNPHKTTTEYIPQREKSRENLLKRRQRAIEIFRKSQKNTTKKTKRSIRQVKKEAELSESSSDNS